MSFVTPKHVALVASLTVTLCSPVFAQGSADVVLEWNRIMVASLAVPGANPPPCS